MWNVDSSKNLSGTADETQRQLKNKERKRNYMREYHARRRQEKKAIKLAEPPPIQEPQPKDVDFESFVPFSTIVVTDRIMTPQDLLVRGHCKRPHSPRRGSNSDAEHNREHKVRQKLQEKGLQPSETNTNVFSVTTTDPKDPAPSNVLQIGYVIPQVGVPDSPIIVPCPVTSNDSSTPQITELNGVQSIQNVVLPQPSAPGRPFLLPAPSVPSTPVQLGDLRNILSIPNIVVPQTSVPSGPYILPVPSGDSTTSNALQIGNMGQVLLIENKGVPQGSVAGAPPVVIMNGEVINKTIVEYLVQDYDDLIPSTVTVGNKSSYERVISGKQKNNSIKQFDKPDYWYPEGSEEKDVKDNIEIVLHDVKDNVNYEQFLDEKITKPQNQGQFIKIKQEYDPDNCQNNNEGNKIMIKEEYVDFDDEIHSQVVLKVENSELNASITVKKEEN